MKQDANFSPSEVTHGQSSDAETLPKPKIHWWKMKNLFRESIDLEKLQPKTLVLSPIRSLEFLKKNRCVIIDYSKIKSAQWTTVTSEYRDEGEYLRVDENGVEEGSWGGRDGGGPRVSLEDFWYDQGRSISNGWSLYVPEILENISAAIVRGNPNEHPPVVEAAK